MDGANQIPQESAGPTTVELQLDIVKLEKEKAQLEQENAEQAQLIQELSNQLEEKAQETPAVFPVVKYEKKEYLVLIPSFSYKGKEYKAAELSKHKEVIASLVKVGSAVLKEKV